MKKTVLKTSLDHLPARYQQDLLAIKEVILKCLPAEMIILFGSYARGNYVEDTYKEDDITYEYTSDYDILVVTQHEIDTINERWRRLNDRLKRRPTPIPTMPINHSIAFLNEKIRHNYYFFVDIIKEGIALYDSGKYDLAA